jgi:hypothetical protein
MRAAVFVVAVFAAVALFARAENEDKEDFGTVIGIDLGTTYSW